MGKLGLNMRFGDFEADFRTRELRKQGVPVKLPRQSFQILQKLLERPGELVTRDELRQALWPGDTFVDFDHGVNNSVKRIRDALGDSPDAPRYIETLPRLGYRFVGSIDEAPVVPVPVVSSAAREEVARRARSRWRFFLLVLALALALAGIAGRWFIPRAKEPVPAVEIVPLTGVIGKQNLASFSPDGIQVTFTLTDDSKLGNGLYTALVGGDTLLQLTDDPRDCCSAWSPDGQAVAFSRNSEEEFTIYTVSPLGGTPRKLYARSRRKFYYYSTNRGQLLAWSPDGKLVAFSEANGEGRSAITLLSLADHSTRHLTSPPVEHFDSQPAFSPDGKTMAFVRTSGPGAVDDLFQVPIEGGVPRRLTFDNREIYGPPAWTEDGQDLIFSSARAGLQRLWRLPAAGGDPRSVAEASTNAYYPAISTKGHRLAYTRRTNASTIWQLTLNDRRHGQVKASVLIAAQGFASHPQFSPDGTKIAFESDRSGYGEIWVCNRDGSDPAQITSMAGQAGTPRWSPDSRSLAFDFRPKEHSEIYVVEVPGGTPRQITTVPGANNVVPSWSRDGQWVYFASRGGGKDFQVWKVPIRGGPAVQMTKKGGFAPLEADDGFLYYAKGFSIPGIWKVSNYGGTEAAVLDTSDAPEWSDWAVVPGGMYFVNSRSSPKPTLEFFDFATARRTSISALDGETQGLAVSPDRKSILYSQLDLDNQAIVVVKNFR
jgi:Tol biopolymer transport system component/DNA-binding winged helix-turn-helix (wHTH) protein